MILSDKEIALYDILKGLSHWTPHSGQLPIGEALFYKGIKNIFVCAGRNFGKTEFSAYASWRYSQQVPGSQSYIFEPFQKQGREILWASRRIQDFGPKAWLDGEPNNTEMRVNFANSSFIKIEGSDNVAAIAGIKPKGLIVYDEFKDHRYESIKNFEPNRAAFDVPGLFIGTPPEFHNHFVDYMEMAKNSPDWLFVHAPTSSNPHISKSWLQKMKAQMIAMGEEEEYLRSYEAIFVIGGKKTVYPQFLKLSFPKFNDVMPRDINKWHLYVSFDPAATSIFGILFAIYNENTKKIIVFDELYEKDPTMMTTRNINKVVEEKISKIKHLVKSINFVYDEAAAYFRNEMSEIDPSKWFAPSQKSRFGVDGYINLVRAVLNKELLTVTDNCVDTIKEHKEYAKDDKGRIPKINDHLCNCLHYLCGALDLNLDEVIEKKPYVDDMRRGYTLDQEIFGEQQSYEELD